MQTTVGGGSKELTGFGVEDDIRDSTGDAASGQLGPVDCNEDEKGRPGKCRLVGSRRNGYSLPVGAERNQWMFESRDGCTDHFTGR